MPDIIFVHNRVSVSGRDINISAGHSDTARLCDTLRVVTSVLGKLLLFPGVNFSMLRLQLTTYLL